jgi:hypothetical protein
VSWKKFKTERRDGGSLELLCRAHPTAHLYVRQVEPARNGGAHLNRVVAGCTECDPQFRIKLGTFRSGQATGRTGS